MADATTVTTFGGKVSTKVLVRGSGVPLLYLHGPFGRVEDELIDLLAQQFTVYAPAHPGFEGSEGYELLSESVTDLVLHYADLLEGLGLDQPVPVVGHSFGAFIAEELAAFYPHLVSRLVLISPLGIWLDDVPQPDLFGLTPRTLAAHLFVDTGIATAQALFQPPADPGESREWNRRRRLAAVGSAKYLWPLPDKGFSTRAHRVKAPTTLIWGAEDQVIPAGPYGKAYEGLIPGATTSVVAGAGHMVVAEKPAEVRDLILEALA